MSKKPLPVLCSVELPDAASILGASAELAACRKAIDAAREQLGRAERRMALAQIDRELSKAPEGADSAVFGVEVDPDSMLGDDGPKELFAVWHAGEGRIDQAFELERKLGPVDLARKLEDGEQERVPLAGRAALRWLAERAGWEKDYDSWLASREAAEISAAAKAPRKPSAPKKPRAL